VKTSELLNLVCEALGRAPDSLSLDDSRVTVPEWDSIGHLAIISIIDEALRVRADDSEMQNFRSLRELATRLQARGVLELD
jgi:acyl carrier protein